MKKTIIFLLLLAFAGMNLATTLTSEKVQPKKVQVVVSGLTCPICAGKLKTGLEKIEGVENVSVDLKKGIATFTIKEGFKVTDEKIKQVVKDEGYNVKEIKYLK